MRRFVRGALWGAAMGLFACGDAGSGRGFDSGPGGAGGKGDDVDDAKEQLSHSDRVELCNLEAEAAVRDSPSLRDQIDAQEDRRDCIAEVNDDIVQQVDERLDDAGHPGAGFTQDVLTDNRTTATAICKQLTEARDDREHPEADLVQAQCEANVELVVANLVGMHVDLGTDPLQIPGAYRRYLPCYDVMPEEEAELDEDAFRDLTSCIHEADVDLSQTVGRRISEQAGKDAERSADAYTNGLDHHRSQLGVLCEHFVMAGPSGNSQRQELTELKCSIAGLEGRGRLIGNLTGLVPDGAAPLPDPEPTPQPQGPNDDPDPPPPPAGDHEELIVSLGGDTVDPYDYPQSLQGFRDYISDVGVVYISGEEIAQPHSPAKASACGYTHLIPDRDQWVKAAALAMLANELRELVGEPIYVRNWWRPDCYNAAVGGAAGGDHPDADAVDLDFQSASSRAKAQRFLCEDYWAADPSLNMSVGLGGVSIHLGLFSKNGRRTWKYSSYTQQSGSGSCW